MDTGRGAYGAIVSIDDGRRIGPSNADCYWVKSARTAFAPPAPVQPFRFGGLFGIDAPFATKGETGAALAGFAVFGLRASLLPRRWDLAIFFSCWRRRASQLLVAPPRRAESRRKRRGATRAPNFTP